MSFVVSKKRGQIIMYYNINYVIGILKRCPIFLPQNKSDSRLFNAFVRYYAVRAVTKFQII